MTNQGKLIRCRVAEIRVAGRNTQGVTLLKTADDETVVSVAKISDNNDDSNDSDYEEIIDNNDV